MFHQPDGPDRRAAASAPLLVAFALWTAILPLVTDGAAFADEVQFLTRTISNTANGATGVFAVDIDGDLDVDVLSSSNADDTIAWYENDGGTPPSFFKRVISATEDGPTAVYAADLDGDDDVDVLSSSRNDDTIAWFENDGGAPPSFTRRDVTTAALGATDVFAADVDGDGDVDVLSSSSDDGTIAWYENNGAMPPAFGAHVITSSAAGALAVHAADVDGDGDIDALSAASFGLDEIAWYENDGGMPPSFTTRTVSTDLVGATCVFAADMNGDGDLDVLSSSGFDDSIAWFESDGGSPPLFTKRIITTDADFALGVYAADVDSDGDIDALSASSSDNSIRWYDNEGGSPPTFTARLISNSADGAAAVLALDLDGDEQIDVLSASSVDDRVAWYENLTESDPCPADLDDDGDVDFQDLLLLLSTWGLCGNCPGDIDEDGFVGPADLEILLGDWGPCPPPTIDPPPDLGVGIPGGPVIITDPPSLGDDPP